MKKLISFLVFNIYFIPGILFASASPVPNLEVTAKQLPLGRVVVVSSDTDGKFSFAGLAAGDYEIFLGGEQISLGKYTIDNNGKISGKVIISIDDENLFKFTEDNWDAIHLKKLGDVLTKENILPANYVVSDVTSTEMKTYIKKFQLKYNIKQTGVFGPKTIKKLNNILNTK